MKDFFVRTLFAMEAEDLTESVAAAAAAAAVNELNVVVAQHHGPSASNILVRTRGGPSQIDWSVLGDGGEGFRLPWIFAAAGAMRAVQAATGAHAAAKRCR